MGKQYYTAQQIRYAQAILRGVQTVGSYVAKKYMANKPKKTKTKKPTGKPIRARLPKKTNSKLTYNTTGYVSKAPKPKPFKKKDFYSEVGSVAIVERGGVQSDANACYLGSATSPFNAVYYSIMRAIVKQLFNQMGISIINWDTPIPTTNGQWECAFTYYEGTTDQTINTSSSVSILSTHTFNTFATALGDQIFSSFSTNVSHQFVEFYINDTTNYGAAPMRKASIRIEDCTLYLQNSVKFQLQNRTQANQALNADDDLTTNISNNPLRTKLYQGNFDGFVPKYRDPTVLSGWGNGFVADIDTGLIVKDADDTIGVAAITNTTFNKPPDGKVFKNCTKTVNLVIKPGEIKHHTLTWKHKGTLNSFFNKYVKNMLVNNVEDIVYLGKSFMFGAEKFLDDRNSDSNVSLAWEMIHTFKAAITVKRNTCSIPLITII